VASNDDVPGAGKYSEVTLGVQAGQVYNIAVDGFDAASGTAQLTYNFQPATIYHFVASSAGGGTVYPSDRYLPLNATVSATANAAPGFQFKQFENAQGQVVSTQNPATFVVSGDLSVVARFEPRTFTDDFEGGFNPGVQYSNNGWAVVGDPINRGNQIASSTTHEDRSTNSLVLLAETPDGIASFDYQVHSEANYDLLQFFVNDVLRGSWSGNVPSTDLSKWSTFQFQVFAGESKLEWRYVKDVAISTPVDAAFIDNINLPSPAPQITAQIKASGPVIQISGAPRSRLVLESSKNLRDWQIVATVTTDEAGVASFSDDSNLAPRFYRLRAQ
jgi:hypothetical protein